MNDNVATALNKQIEIEGYSSQLYLAMASWAEKNGYQGSAQFLFQQADEERVHMLKLFHYINDRGGYAIVPTLHQPPHDFGNIKSAFEQVLNHEKFVSNSINELVGVCVENRDFTTQNFLQWYISEQIEEETTARSILDKLYLLGDDPARMYLFDRDIATLATQKAAEAGAADKTVK